MPARLATRREIATEKRIIETIGKVIRAGSIISLPIVDAVSFPAMIAPRKTIIPNRPGIRFLFITFAPYAAENEGPVPLPPIFIAKNIAMINGISRWLNNGEVISYLSGSECSLNF